MRQLVIARAASGVIEATAQAAGMRTMRQDGLSRVLAGLTSFSEVARVTETGE